MKKSLPAPESLHQTLQEMYGVLKCAREECIEYLTELIDKRGDIIIYSDQPPTVCYDGGYYPEHSSNMYSCVEGLFINDDGLLCFNIEDSACYEINRVLTTELCWITEFIINNPDCLTFSKDEELD